MKIYKDAIVNLGMVDFAKSWYLWGKVGVGKTHNAYGYVQLNNDVLRHKQKEDEKHEKFCDYPFLTFINWAIICERLRNTPIMTDVFISDNRGEKEDSLMNKKKLIIDDLAAEKRSDYTDDLLMRLVEHRYSNALYTGFTSNISMGKLPYDARIVSRIVGIVGKNKFEIIGKDRRV